MHLNLKIKVSVSPMVDWTDDPHSNRKISDYAPDKTTVAFT